VVAGGVACLVASLFLVPSPGSAEPPAAKKPAPTISAVEHQLDTLNRQAEIASEQFDTVRVHLQQADTRLTSLRADLTRQQAQVGQLRTEIVQSALSDYVSTGGLSSSASFLVSKKPSQFIDALATTAIVEHQQASMLAQLHEQQNQLGVQEQQAARAVSAIAADRHQLALQRADVQKKLHTAQTLLESLQAQQRTQVVAQQQHSTDNPGNYTPPSRGGERPPHVPTPPASGRAGIAVQTALAQLGKPYVWGAAGPNSFDCSGLTMYSWAAAGVALSDSSSIQSQQGSPVAISDLEPGDLVFYYSPVSHVAMYIGNGNVVHAPHPGSVVQIVPLESMPIAWARRVG
jgi:cell wall-associated NlpC family hydrolase